MKTPVSRVQKHTPRVVTASLPSHAGDLLSWGIILLLGFVLVVLVTVSRTQAQSRTQESLDPNLLNTGNVSSWTNSSCGNCHDNDALFSHPVNVIAPMGVPAGLPLENGRVTCVTCHDNASVELHMQARTNHTPMLRDLGPVNLCQQCHESTPSMHASRLDQAHFNNMSARHGFGSTSKTSASNVSLEIDPDGMDSVTRNCLTCHDGSVAKDVSSGTSMLNRRTLGSRADHPLGVYPTNGIKAVPTGEMDYFVNPNALDSRIHLVEGKVSCVSCHSPYSSENKLLVMSNSYSKLCLSCHVDRE